MELLKVIFTILTLLTVVKCVIFELENSKIRVEFIGIREDRRLRINFYEADNWLLQRIILDENFDVDTEIKYNKTQFTLRGRNNHNLTINVRNQNFQFTRNLRYDEKSQDCFYLNIGHVNWYGGPEDRHQLWPAEEATYQNYSYVLTKENICYMPRRHWLSSRGVAILPERTVPLFVDQNTKENENQLCFTAALKPPYKNNEIYEDSEINTFQFSYNVIIAKNMRLAHMEALELIEKPKVLLDETIIRHPTWALYGDDINARLIGAFVTGIVERGFYNGLVEVENAWKMSISNLRNVTRDIEKLGFRMTLLTHYFSDLNIYELPHRYQMYPSALIADDLTYHENRYLLFALENLTDIHSYKFDVQVPQYKIYFNSETIKQSPVYYNPITRRPQCHQFYVQMMDKNNLWTHNNGLPTLITTLLQMNIAGYPFVIPAMIGGNKNHSPTDKELFIRWMQATVFMPSMQFSHFPWFYDQETVDLTKKFLDLHTTWADYILDRFRISLETGEPVNPPLWWLDTGDLVARQIKDQFLLGDKVIVAPVLVQGQTERDIYLPTGIWTDGNTQKTEKGPKWLPRYPAPLTVLPYFYKD